MAHSEPRTCITAKPLQERVRDIRDALQNLMVDAERLTIVLGVMAPTMASEGQPVTPPSLLGDVAEIENLVSDIRTLISCGIDRVGA